MRRTTANKSGRNVTQASSLCRARTKTQSTGWKPVSRWGNARSLRTASGCLGLRLAPTARPQSSLGQRPRFSAHHGLGLKARSNSLPVRWVGPTALDGLRTGVLGRCPTLVWGRAFGAECAIGEFVISHCGQRRTNRRFEDKCVPNREIGNERVKKRDLVGTARRAVLGRRLFFHPHVLAGATSPGRLGEPSLPIEAPLALTHDLTHFSLI